MASWRWDTGSTEGGPSTLIKLYPYAIAGFIGIVINSLNLLPVANTDGGRVAQAMFRWRFANVIRGTTLVLMDGAGLFFLLQHIFFFSIRLDFQTRIF